MILYHFAGFQAFPSLPVLPRSYPFFCFDPFSEFCLKNLPFHFREKVTLLRFWSLKHFGSGKGSFIRNLPHPGNVTLSRFGHRLSVFPTPKPWDLISYPNAHEIPPLEFFPFWRRVVLSNNPILSLRKLSGSDQAFRKVYQQHRIQSIGPSKNPYAHGEMLLPPDGRCSFGVLPF